jgi:hypothetical protein
LINRLLYTDFLNLALPRLPLPENMDTIRNAIAALINKPIAVILIDGTRLHTTFSKIEGDFVLLAGGGFLKINDVRSFFPVSSMSSGQVISQISPIIDAN